MEERRRKLRYRVERTASGSWAVVDHHVSKIRMHNDVIDTFPAREAARVRCRELNDGDEDGRAEASAT